MSEDRKVTPSEADIEAAGHADFMLGCKSRLEGMLADPFVGDFFPFRRRVETRDSRLSTLCQTLSSSGLPMSKPRQYGQPIVRAGHGAGNPLIIGGRKYYTGQPVHPERFAEATPEQRAEVNLPGSQFFWAGDPLWSTLFVPPSYFECRCSVIPYSLKDAAKTGVIVAQQWLETGIKPPDKMLRVRRPRVRLAKKWIAYLNSLKGE
jgi:hypothetical protein